MRVSRASRAVGPILATSLWAAGAFAEGVISSLNGAPVENSAASHRIGNQLQAALLYDDINLFEAMQHVVRERIPERMVHAKGTGAHGYFEVTDDISDLTSAAFLNETGKKTDVFCRFSTFTGGRDSADTVRDPRGFAIKLYTEQGNLDWMTLSGPVFPIRDPGKFPSFLHSAKKNPKTGLADPTSFWDFFSRNGETINFLMHLFSDGGTPRDLQHMDAFAVHTYRFTQPDGSGTYVKLHFLSTAGVQNLTLNVAAKVSGIDPDFQVRQLYDAIEDGDYPQFDVYAQVIDPAKAEAANISMFDVTKTFPTDTFPLRKFGRIVLNRNVDNYFAEVEQSAFSPSNIVPGWALTPDPILQVRLLAYTSAQRYRLGTNFQQIPVNMPQNNAITPLIRDGSMVVNGNSAGLPSYNPSSFSKVDKAPQYSKLDTSDYSGQVVNFESELTDADFDEPRSFWENDLGSVDGQQTNFIINVAVHLSGVSGDQGDAIRDMAYDLFGRVNSDLSSKIKAATDYIITTKYSNSGSKTNMTTTRDLGSRSELHKSTRHARDFTTRDVDDEVPARCPFGFDA